MTSSERPLSHRGNKENVNVSSILEEENTQLKKQVSSSFLSLFAKLRQTDNELKKTKAVLEQKVEQLTA